MKQLAIHRQVRKSLLWLFLFIVFFVISVAAVKETLHFHESETGLQISHNLNPFIKQGEYYNVDLLVYNSTNYLLSNTLTDCYLFLYHSNGTLTYNSTFSNIGEYQKRLTLNGQFSNNGYYTISFYCNSSTEAGFLEYPVTLSNTYEDDTLYVNYLPILLSILSAAIVFLFSSKLITSNKLMMLKGVLFLTGASLGAISLFIPYLISLNPGRVDYGSTWYLGLLSVGLVLVLTIIFTYGLYLFQRLRGENAER